jgi:hypothetical protein
MRLWSLNPRYLDVKGLLAVWREGLLAQAVLSGLTHGYTNHPQLERFKSQPQPLEAIQYYLEIIAEEAACRGYHFNIQKVTTGFHPKLIEVTEGQIKYELEHLKKKLAVRDPARRQQIINLSQPDPHPLFTIIPGEIEAWEKV